MDVPTDRVRNVAIWGNSGETELVDMEHADIKNDKGVRETALKLVDNEDWMRHTFLSYVRMNTSENMSPSKIAMLKAKAIVDHGHDLWLGTKQVSIASPLTLFVHIKI